MEKHNNRWNFDVQSSVNIRSTDTSKIKVLWNLKKGDEVTDWHDKELKVLTNIEKLMFVDILLLIRVEWR